MIYLRYKVMNGIAHTIKDLRPDKLQRIGIENVAPSRTIIKAYVRKALWYRRINQCTMFLDNYILNIVILSYGVSV